MLKNIVSLYTKTITRIINELKFHNIRVPDPTTEYQLATTLVLQNDNVAIYYCSCKPSPVNLF